MALGFLVIGHLFPIELIYTNSVILHTYYNVLLIPLLSQQELLHRFWVPQRDRDQLHKHIKCCSEACKVKEKGL